MPTVATHLLTTIVKDSERNWEWRGAILAETVGYYGNLERN